MKLDVTKEEHAVLATLFTQMQQAMRDFQVAFKVSMAARKISDATFVSLSPEHLEITVPE